jgi:hypothetical protein
MRGVRMGAEVMGAGVTGEAMVEVAMEAADSVAEKEAAEMVVVVKAEA